MELPIPPSARAMSTRPKRKGLPIALAWLAIATAFVARDASAQVVAEHAGAAFPLGPYTALYVDAANPSRLAIGTSGGLVAWSDDAGRTSHDSRVISPRRFDPAPVRGDIPRARFARGLQSDRATRLFIESLRRGARVGRFSHWMTLADPYTEITSVTMPSTRGQGSGGRLMVGAPVGLYLSDLGGQGWTRTFGGPGPMPREHDSSSFAVTIDPADPRHVIAGTTDGILVSENGGFTFSPHPDSQFQGEYVTKFQWDALQPGLLLAFTYNALLQSFDAGRSFQVVYSEPEAEVLGAAILEEGGYIATSDGLVIVDPESGENRILRGRRVAGVALFAEGIVVASDTDLTYYDAAATPHRLASTTPDEPFVSLQGGPTLAWAMTPQTLFRIGAPSRTLPDRAAPQLLLTVEQVEHAVHAHLRWGGPSSTRINPRWYAHIVPRVVVDVFGTLEDTSSTTRDGTFPIRYRRAEARSEDQLGVSVMAFWDLSTLFVGDQNVSNPNLFIESNLRESRRSILQEVRRRYREAAFLARRLERPPADPLEQVSLRLRLQEHAAYLEALAGREVVSGEDL